MPGRSNPIQNRKETYVTIAEAGEYLRVSPRTVYQWLKLGKLKCFRVGSTTRIPLLELDRFVAENTGLSAEEKAQ
jgi:excisionase family DNA binding protein